MSATTLETQAKGERIWVYDQFNEWLCLEDSEKKKERLEREEEKQKQILKEEQEKIEDEDNEDNLEELEKERDIRLKKEEEEKAKKEKEKEEKKKKEEEKAKQFEGYETIEAYQVVNDSQFAFQDNKLIWVKKANEGTTTSVVMNQLNCTEVKTDSLEKRMRINLVIYTEEGVFEKELVLDSNTVVQDLFDKVLSKELRDSFTFCSFACFVGDERIELVDKIKGFNTGWEEIKKEQTEKHEQWKKAKKEFDDEKLAKKKQAEEEAKAKAEAEKQPEGEKVSEESKDKPEEGEKKKVEPEASSEPKVETTEENKKVEPKVPVQQKVETEEIKEGGEEVPVEPKVETEEIKEGGVVEAEKSSEPTEEKPEEKPEEPKPEPEPEYPPCEIDFESLDKRLDFFHKKTTELDSENNILKIQKNSSICQIQELLPPKSGEKVNLTVLLTRPTHLQTAQFYSTVLYKLEENPRITFTPSAPILLSGFGLYGPFPNAKNVQAFDFTFIVKNARTNKKRRVHAQVIDKNEKIYKFFLDQEIFVDKGDFLHISCEKKKGAVFALNSTEPYFYGDDDKGGVRFNVLNHYWNGIASIYYRRG